MPARESRADPPAPPPEYQALYDELSQKLTAFETQLDAEWDDSVGPNRFAGALGAANGNKSIALLTPTSWNGSLAMLDMYETIGVEVIKLEVEYPVFTDAFHDWLAANPPPAMNPYTVTVDNFIGFPNSFYNRLVTEIRSRGLGIWVEHGTLFADYSPTPATGYFAEMRAAGVNAARQRYSDERSAEAALIVSQLAPDYYSILEEPETQNDNFGYFPGNVPLYSPTQWRDYVLAAAAAIAAASPGSATLLGAGMGTWDNNSYVQLFAPLPELDYIDLHIYPIETIGQSFYQNALDWTDYIRGVDPAKKILVGETWLYKASVDDLVSGVNYNTLISRDVWSFWEPLDRQFHDILFKLMHHKDVELVMPFWIQYYFAYIEYGDPTVQGLSGPELIAEAGQRAGPNLLSMTLTGTGQRFVELLSAANDADGDGIPDSADSSDSDADLLADNVEHYCGSPANDGLRRPERLDGPFTTVDDDGDTMVDEGLPAGAAGYDCDGDGYRGDGAGAGNISERRIYGAAGTANDQDACGNSGWPADLATTGPSANRINLTDVSSFIAPLPRKLNTDPGDPGYDVRWDLVTGNGAAPPKDISLTDLTNITTLVPPMLGVKAFSGPVCPWPP